MSKKGPTIKWNAQEDKALCDALIEKKSKGKQSDGGWKSTVWIFVSERVADEEGEGEKTPSKCQNHFKNLKDAYADNKRLQNMSGFGWDDEKKMVTAGDSQWDALKKTKAKVKANLALWKNVAFPLYDKMALLCDGHMADGGHAFHPSDPLPADPLGWAQDFFDGNTSGIDHGPGSGGEDENRDNEARGK
ncbi:hypothetical protein E1B28_010576 [Marasmius oreades]|uniref:Myb/SANT-like domain-containing protein n=1 Tax=Marasmius oreades TaxID=181124 RepID=A0A9P7UR98_9AGAR|nr:uncharacterized protein E1B28_010576 [Marasmius oreades]KAG7091547.1 hypothetical protein E1B28_010576 [Marasmius oreades]